MTATIQQRVSLEEYLAAEQRDGVRYEYHDGILTAMPGGTLPHTIIASNAVLHIGIQLMNHDLDCIALSSELKVEIEHSNRYVYPDAAIICGAIDESSVLTGAAQNPRVVLEVVSKSSAGYDLGRKQGYYFSLSSVQEYLLIDQQEPRVTIIRRGDRNDLFTQQIVEGLDSAIDFTSLPGCSVKLSDLYRRVEFKAE